jgi:putative restriction endonuclease
LQIYKAPFTNYIHANNVTGSKKAASYIRAIDLLNKMIQSTSFEFEDCKNVWSVNSVERLQELYLFVLMEGNKGDESAWNIKGIPTSYLQKGYCSAALKSYQEFLVEHVYEQELLTIFNEHKGDESKVVEKLDREIHYPNSLLEGLEEKHGREVVRSVRVRSNQNVFRLMILKIYNESCCITGLNIPEVNRASHIIPWSENPSQRLNPRNGICLSATYDAAFDKNLISLDEDYRIIISKEISDHYSNSSVEEHFYKKEGQKITLPTSYLPHQDYLDVHRKKGRF